MPLMIKPRTLGVLTKAERTRNGASYIVSALGMFDLAQPDAPRFETEQALWLLAAKALPKGAVLDISMPKPRAELLLGGSARAPEGQSTSAMAVEWSVGPLNKRLVVFGDRYWTMAGHGYAATPPRPFVEVPLSPERAFGGEGHADNPQGIGHRAAARIRAGELVALPNVEYADRLVLTTESSPDPALCGPIDLASPKRRRYAGTYDRHWIKNVAPALPDDVDPRFFLTAPDDQVFPDYLKGGEPYALRGFCAEQPELRGALPAFRVRCFLARKGQGGAADELVEMAMRIDTLWLFAGARRGVLIYRGAPPVADIDAEDLSAVMLAYERGADEPRSFESYVEVWKLRRDRKSAFKYAFAENQLAPALPRQTIDRRNTERRAQAQARLDKHHAGSDWAFQRQMDKAGIAEALRPAPPSGAAHDYDELILSIPQPTAEEIEEGDIDLAGLLDGMETLEKTIREKTDKLSAQGAAAQDAFAAVRAPGADAASVDALLAAIDDLTGGSAAADIDAGAATIGGASPDAGAAAAAAPELETARNQTKNWRESLLKALGDAEVDEDKEYDAARARFLDLPEGRPLAAARSALETAQRQDLKLPDSAAPKAAATPTKAFSIEALLDDLDGGSANPSAPAAAKSDPPSAKEHLTKTNERLAAALPNLPSESGSPLEALLAAIQQPALDPSDAKAAAKERLDDAARRMDEQEADMITGMAQTRRLAPEPMYPRTPMTRPLAQRFGRLILSELPGGLSLRGRDMAGADLRGADLAGVDLEGALLERADLSGARLSGARLVNAALAGAVLDDADLSGVDLSNANLAKCHAHGADFSRSRFTGSLLLEADFSRSKFLGAQIEKVKILKSTFDDADFSGSRLSQTPIVQTSLERTVWNQADLEAVAFMDLSLAGATLRGARIFRCVFLKARARATDFDGADITRSAFTGEVDLANARFVGATGADCTFHEVTLTGGNFERGVFNRATFVKSDLTGASFRLASLKGALFGSAKLAGADFIGANLLKAQLRRTDLSGARLIGANLYGADLDHAILTAADFSGANLAKTLLAVDSHVG